MQYFKTPVLAKAAAAVATAFALQGAAMAAPAAGPAMQGPAAMSSQHSAAGMHAHGHMRHAWSHAGLWVPGYGPVSAGLVKSLKLTAEQTKLVADARSVQKAAMHERFKEMKQVRKEYWQQLRAGTLDPHAAVQQADAAMQKGLAQRQDVTKKWLAVWDALDSTQQKQVAAYIKGRADSRRGHYGHFRHSHRSGHEMRTPQQPAQQAPGQSATPAS